MENKPPLRWGGEEIFLKLSFILGERVKETPVKNEMRFF